MSQRIIEALVKITQALEEIDYFNHNEVMAISNIAHRARLRKTHEDAIKCIERYQNVKKD